MRRDLRSQWMASLVGPGWEVATGCLCDFATVLERKCSNVWASVALALLGSNEPIGSVINHLFVLFFYSLGIKNCFSLTQIGFMILIFASLI